MKRHARHRRGTGVTACIISACVLGRAAPVWGQAASRLSLKWNAPAGCPSHDDVQSRVDALLGEASVSRVSDVQAAGQVQRLNSGFRLELSMVAADRPSSRVIDASNCDELAGAAAIAIALLARSSPVSASASDQATVDGAQALGDSQSNTSGRGATTADQQSPPPPVAAEKPTRDDAARERSGKDNAVHLVLDAPLALASWGALPGMGMGLGGAAGVRWRALRVVAGGEWWQPKTTTLNGFSAKFRLQSAHVEACLTQASSGVELGACAGVAVERLMGQGTGSETYAAESGRSQWVAGTGGVLVAVPIPGFAPLRLLGQAAVRVPAVRTRFFIEQLGLVHQPPLAAPTLTLGCEWIL